MFLIFGNNGERYTVYRESQTKVLCNNDHDGLESLILLCFCHILVLLMTHPGYPDPDASGSQLKENPEQGKTSANPEP